MCFHALLLFNILQKGDIQKKLQFFEGPEASHSVHKGATLSTSKSSSELASQTDVWLVRSCSVLY